MIRAFCDNDLDRIAEIWLNTNRKAHDFIPEEYWKGNFSAVKDMLPQAEIYVCQDEDSGELLGFIGLNREYIEGIFVRNGEQSRGIGKCLLDFVKSKKGKLSLNVYQKNQRAVRFYQREQFRIAEEGMDVNTGEKEYRMVWKNAASE